MSEPRVLSISSFVVHGFAGNKCNMYALHTLEIDVDPIFTVQFSKHTGYSTRVGPILSSEQLVDIFHGLQANVLKPYTHMITGYCNDVSTVREIAKIAKELQAKNPNMMYFCDPVMGDNGKLYVKAEIADIYRSEVVPLADIVKLNKTEAEVLTGLTIETNADINKVLDALHAMGPKTVIVSSCPASCFDGIDDKVEGAEMIYVAGSYPDAEKGEGHWKRFFIKVRKVEGYFVGTGDLFSTVIVGWMAKGRSVEEACGNAVSTLKAVLERTAADKSFELRLVQSKKAVENPPPLEFPIKYF